MKLIGAYIGKASGATKTCVFEKDADFVKSCFRENGKLHRPDMVCDNLLDDNIKYVFDLTNTSAFTRMGNDVIPRENYMLQKEDEKRKSPAWKNFMPQDGLVSEFVPIAIGWFGEFGPAFKDFIDRVSSHFDQGGTSEKEKIFAAKWRSRRFSAAVQVRHLNTIGLYLNSKREMYQRLGSARKRNTSGIALDLCAPANGAIGDGFSNFARDFSGSPLLAISEKEETRRVRAVVDVASADDTLVNLGDVLEVEGIVGGAVLTAA